MRYLASTFTCLTLLLLAACSAMIEDVTSVAVHGASDYDPQAPSIRIPSMDAALASAPWISAGSFQITALNSLNQPDHETLRALRFSVSDYGLTINSVRPLTSAGLYVKYDASQLHPVQLGGSQRTDGIALTARFAAGILAVGVAAEGQGTLDPSVPLVSLTFAPGADTAVRVVSIKNIPSNSVGSDAGTADDLVAVDNVNSSATLSWLEQHTGDYDLNGVVNISDISRIGPRLGNSTTDGTDDAKDEVVDGDNNGLITIAELTPLGGNLGSTLAGYNVYRTLVTGPGDNPDPSDTGRWTKVENSVDPQGPSAPRQFNQQQTRLSYSFIDASGNGEFAWYVAPVSLENDPYVPEGPASNVVKQLVTPAGPPPAGLSFEIVAPETEFQSVNDEFYLAVKITGVDSLFSANVRFEYDDSVVDFIEGVAAYNDGTDHPNFLEPPLFVSVDDVDAAASPYVLLGFNATQTQGTPTKTGDGYLGYFKFRASAPGIITSAFRFPQSTNFIYLWGENYGEAVATPALGGPQLLNIAP